MVPLLRMAFLTDLYAYGKQANNNSENCPEDSPPGDFVFTERSADSSRLPFYPIHGSLHEIFQIIHLTFYPLLSSFSLS